MLMNKFARFNSLIANNDIYKEKLIFMHHLGILFLNY
ncbi:MAG: hypothetical protein K0R54_1173 [Clostridiaceae bacterium]|jgi:hypothetical protein|nr:hypothetical protein [Clostridiaceae bacterium]